MICIQNMFKISLVILLILMLSTMISFGQDSALKYYQVGLRLYEQGCNAEGFEPDICNKAIENMEKAIEVNPQLAGAYAYLGRAYWNQSFVSGKSDQKNARDKALVMIRKSLSIESENIEAMEFLSNITDDEKERESLLKKIIRINPKYSEAHRRLAFILVSQGKFDEAVNEYNLYLEASPITAVTYIGKPVYFGQLLTQAGRAKEAVDIYMNLLDRMRELSRFEKCQVFKSLDIGPYSKYSDFTERIMKSRPFCSQTDHRDKAVQLQKEEKTDEAIRELELQIKENPYFEESYFLLEDIYKSKGQMDKALFAIKRYYEFEKDVTEKCKKYNNSNINLYKQHDKQFVENLRKECGQAKKTTR